MLKDNEIRALKLKVNPSDEIERLQQESEKLKEVYETEINLLKEENYEYSELLKETQDQAEYLKSVILGKDKEIAELRQSNNNDEVAKSRSRNGELLLALAENANLKNELQILQTKLEDAYLSK